MHKKGWIGIWAAAILLLTGCMAQEKTIQILQTESPTQEYADVALETIEAQPDQWGNNARIGNIVSYEGFCGKKLVIVKEEESGKQIGLLDETGEVDWTQSVFPNISNIYLSGEYAVVETNEMGESGLYLIHIDGGKREIDRFSASEKVTNVSWSEDGRYFIYVICQQNDYVGKVYDVQMQSMQTYSLGNYLPGEWGWAPEAITPLYVTISQENYLAVQFIYQNDTYLVSIKLPEHPVQGIDLGSALVRKCSQEPVIVSQGILYYIDVDGKLNALSQDGSGERTIASNVKLAAVSKQGENLAYLVQGTYADQIYVAKKQETTRPKLMDIRSDVKKLAFDDEGVQLMVQYSEREQQEQGKCVVLKIED